MKEIKKIQTKIDTLDERLANGEIEKPLYKKVNTNERKALVVLEKKLLLTKPSSIPSIDSGIEEALSLAQNMHNLWLEGDVYQKRRLQKLVFPKGVIYHPEKFFLEAIEVEKTLFSIKKLK